jgi:predicted membrane protein
MREDPKTTRTLSLVFAVGLSVPLFIIGIVALPFSDETRGLYDEIIKLGFMAAVSILPAFALVLFSLRLLAWYLRLAAALIYAGEFLIIWGDCLGTHFGWTGWVPVNFLMAAIGSSIAPQVFLIIAVVSFVEYAYRRERLHAAPPYAGEL